MRDSANAAGASRRGAAATTVTTTTTTVTTTTSDGTSVDAAASGEFDLYLRVAGLCMYVDDTAGADKRLHVLLPRTGSQASGDHAHGAAPVMAHMAAILYDRSHAMAASTGRTTPVHLPLDGLAVSFPQVEADPSAVVQLPDERFLEACEHDHRLVDRALLTDAPAGEPPPELDHLLARVTLARGVITDVLEGAYWHIGGKRRRLATAATWKVAVPGSTLEIRLTGLGDPDSVSVRHLRPVENPVTKRWEVNLFVYHSPELPSVVPPPRGPISDPVDDYAHHVAAFENLFVSHRIPRFDSLAETTGGTGERDEPGGSAADGADGADGGSEHGGHHPTSGPPALRAASGSGGDEVACIGVRARAQS